MSRSFLQAMIGTRAAPPASLVSLTGESESLNASEAAPPKLSDAANGQPPAAN